MIVEIHINIKQIMHLIVCLTVDFLSRISSNKSAKLIKKKDMENTPSKIANSIKIIKI